MLVCTKKIFFEGRLWAPGETREPKGNEPKSSFAPQSDVRVVRNSPTGDKPVSLREASEGKTTFSDQILDRPKAEPVRVIQAPAAPVDPEGSEDPLQGL